MKQISFLFVLAVLAIASCAKTKTANISTNIQAESNNSVVANSVANTNLSNQNAVSEIKSEGNGDMLKQIEAQQLETADPRKAAKQNGGNTNQSSPKTAPAGRQTW